MDYAVLPPEINSGRLYAGPGSAPLMAAASAWRALAGELSSTLTSYETVTSQLTDEAWMGPASSSMTAAVKPYLAWLTETAATAEEAGSQASAAAAAFETAHANTPPPAVIAANRAQQTNLVATNFLGRNIAAIMANETAYQQMWAQAASVMYSYAASSASAAQISPFSQPDPTTNPAGQGNQAAATAQAAAAPAGSAGGQIAQLMPSLQSSLQNLASPAAAATQPAASGQLSGLLNAFLANASVNGIASLLTDPLNGALSFGGTSLAYMPATLIPTMISFFTGGGFNAIGGGSAGAALLGPGGPLSALGALGGGASSAAASAFTASAGTPAVSAAMGEASLVSSFSAPGSWPAATPAGAGSVAAEVSGWAVAPEELLVPENHSMASLPGGIPVGEGRGGLGLSTPRYGFKPTVMPRPMVG